MDDLLPFEALASFPTPFIEAVAVVGLNSYEIVFLQLQHLALWLRYATAMDVVVVAVQYE